MLTHEAKQRDFNDIHSTLRLNRQRCQFLPGLLEETQLEVALSG
jgi:hypothetical protein